MSLLIQTGGAELKSPSSGRQTNYTNTDGVVLKPRASVTLAAQTEAWFLPQLVSPSALENQSLLLAAASPNFWATC